MINDSNLAQCEFCGFVTDWDDVPMVNDHYSDGAVTCCPECNQGESFTSYKPDPSLWRKRQIDEGREEISI